MPAGTVDALAGGGRVIAGLGVSGPQIVEGWYGQPWGKPYWRLRDYVAIMRKVFERKDPVSPRRPRDLAAVHRPRRARPRQAAASILHMNPRLPIWLGTGTESNVKLTAELADGWLPLRLRAAAACRCCGRGWRKASARAGGGKGLRRLRDPAARRGDHHRRRRAARSARMKPRVALYVGGMGHRDKNFHKEMMVRARLRRRRAAHPGAVPRQAQGRGDRRRPRRVLRRDGAGGAGRRASASAIAPGPTAASPG